VRARLLIAGLAALTTGVAAAQPAPPILPPDTPEPAIVDGTAQRALDDARSRWRRARMHDYRFRLRRLCFCPTHGAVVLRVRRDRPVRPPADLRDVATVRRLHRVVQRAIDARVHRLSVRYGPRGVPRDISIDGHAPVSDDEVSYLVDRVRRLSL
jgi:hypothetical protein